MSILPMHMQCPICWKKIDTWAESTGKICDLALILILINQSHNAHHYHHHNHQCISISASLALHQRQCITISASLSLHPHQCIIISASSSKHHYHCILIISASMHQWWIKHSENSWFDGLAVFLWWFLELYSWSRFLVQVHDVQRCSKRSSHTKKVDKGA